MHVVFKFPAQVDLRAVGRIPISSNSAVSPLIGWMDGDAFATRQKPRPVDAMVRESSINECRSLSTCRHSGTRSQQKVIEGRFTPSRAVVAVAAAAVRVGLQRSPLKTTLRTKPAAEALMRSGMHPDAPLTHCSRSNNIDLWRFRRSSRFNEQVNLWRITHGSLELSARSIGIQSCASTRGGCFSGTVVSSSKLEIFARRSGVLPHLWWWRSLGS